MAATTSIGGPAPRHTANASPLVLLIDDDATIRAGFRRVLVRGGFTVLDAADANTAIAITLGLGRVDLFLCDVNLPDMRGDELVQRLAALSPYAKVIFLSGEAPTTIDLTAAVFVSKPVRASDLLARVTAAIGPGDM